MKVRILPEGHGSEPVEVKLGHYGHIEVMLDGKKVRISPAWWEGPYLAIRVEELGGCLQLRPRVANEVYVGVEH